MVSCSFSSEARKLLVIVKRDKPAVGVRVSKQNEPTGRPSPAATLVRSSMKARALKNAAVRKIGAVLDSITQIVLRCAFIAWLREQQRRTRFGGPRPSTPEFKAFNWWLPRPGRCETALGRNRSSTSTPKCPVSRPSAPRAPAVRWADAISDANQAAEMM